MGDFALLWSVACALRANKKQQKSNQQRKKMDKILTTTEESETDLPRLFRHIEEAEHNKTSAMGLSLYYRYFVKKKGFYGDKSLRFVGIENAAITQGTRST